MHKGLTLAAACLLVAVSARGQEKPLMAEDVFKNIQVLKGIPVREFMNTMGFFSASTNLNCIDCHSPESESLEGYAIDTPRKQTARRMVLMVNQINQSNFGGRRLVTCYTCHRASDRPEAIPSLLDQYSVPEDDPNRVEVIPAGPVQSVKQVSADQILDKYIQAIGGAAQVARLTSLAAKGTYEGYETLSAKVPVDIFATAQSAHDGRPHPERRQRQHVRRRQWVDGRRRQADARAAADGRRSRGRQDGRVAVVSREDQAGLPVAHGLSIGHDRRQARSGHPERGTRRNRRQAVLRQRVWPSRAAGPLRRHGRRRHPDAGRLRGLPRRRGREGAVPARDYLDRRPIHDRAQPGATERANRCGAVCQTRRAEGQGRGSVTLRTTRPREEGTT